MTPLKEGDKAPFFKGLNQDGREISLDDFKGKKLILYFYPKDNTSGCTAEACSLNENYDTLTAKGYEVVGVSPDSINSHQKFIAKYNLSFHLIADVEKNHTAELWSLGRKIHVRTQIHGSTPDHLPYR